MASEYERYSTHVKCVSRHAHAMRAEGNASISPYFSRYGCVKVQAGDSKTKISVHNFQSVTVE
jgi:hypothetical protein